MVREPSAGYHADDEVGPHLRDKVRAAGEAVADVLAAATDPGEPGGGELGGLLELLGVIDSAQAAAVELTATVQRSGAAERTTSLPLEGLLSFRSRATHGHRRALVAAAEQLPTMPHLRRAFRAGALGWAEVRAVLAEARRLTVEQRARLDEGFADLERLARWEPDQLVEVVGDTVAALRPDLDTRDARGAIEHRFLALQPALDGSGSGYFELDAAAYGVVAEAIDAALAPLSAGPRDVTRDAWGEADPEATDGEAETPQGEPALCDPVERRDRARARADALVRLAGSFLAGPTGSAQGVTDLAARPLQRARPALQVVCDIRQLTGHDRAATAARALVASIGGPVRLTPETVRRLACDGRLQAIFTDGGEVLGTTDPVEGVPVAVRRAVQARDRGCRFPGCTLPVHWTDAHHVRFRRHGGPTTVDNLVLLCRRHHTAVHEGGWRLGLTPDGTVTVRRGRHRHTSDPPLRRALLPP